VFCVVKMKSLWCFVLLAVCVFANEFTPSKLPCSYLITGSFSKPDFFSGENKTCDFTIAKNTDIIGLYSQVCVGDQNFTSVVRGDLEQAGFNIPSATVDSSSCTVDMVGYDDAVSVVGSFSSIVNLASFEYDEVTKKTVDNVEYDVYIANTLMKTTSYYINEDGFIARIEEEDSFGNSAYVFNYTFEGLSKSMFVIDSELFSSPCNDSRLYQAPDVDFCSVFTPPELACSFSTNMTQKMEDETEEFSLHVMTDPNDVNGTTVYLTLDNEPKKYKTIFRMEPQDFDLVSCVNITGSQVGTRCSYAKSLPLYVVLYLQIFVGVYYSDFAYISQEEVACGTDMCTKYCQDVSKTTCVTVLNSEPHYIVKYERINSGFPLVHTYTPLEEVTDMSVFALDSFFYPGCEDHPEAYRAPKNYCVNDSSSSSAIPSYSSQHSSSSSVVPSSSLQHSSSSSVVPSSSSHRSSAVVQDSSSSNRVEDKSLASTSDITIGFVVAATIITAFASLL